MKVLGRCNRPDGDYIAGMELYLLRHGRAVERGRTGFTNDADRPLTPKGRRELRKISRAMKKMDLSFDLIFSSQFLRAKQTAELIADEMTLNKRFAFANELRPGGDANKLIQFIAGLKPQPGNILLVGHEPDLSELISLLVSGSTGAGFELKKTGLAKLEIGKLQAKKCAALAWLLTPKLMRLMA